MEKKDTDKLASYCLGGNVYPAVTSESISVTSEGKCCGLAILPVEPPIVVGILKLTGESVLVVGSNAEATLDGDSQTCLTYIGHALYVMGHNMQIQTAFRKGGEHTCARASGYPLIPQNQAHQNSGCARPIISIWSQQRSKVKAQNLSSQPEGMREESANLT